MSLMVVFNSFPAIWSVENTRFSGRDFLLGTYLAFLKTMALPFLDLFMATADAMVNRSRRSIHGSIQCMHGRHTCAGFGRGGRFGCAC